MGKGIKFGILAHIDTKDMSDEDRKMWEKIDEALGTAGEEYLKENIKIEDIKTSIVDSIKGMDEFKQADISGLLSKKEFSDKIKEVEDTLIKLKGLTESGNRGRVVFKSLEDQVAEQLKDFIKEEKGGKTIDLREACKSSPGYKKTLNLVLNTKASTVTAGGVAPHIGLNVDTVLDVEPRAQTIIRQYANVASTNGRSLVIAEFVPGVGDAEWVPEGGLKPAMDSTLQERTITVAKVALTSKLTEETLTDLPQLVSEIRSELLSRIDIREEDGILNGDGLNGEIKGVLADLPGFAMTGLTVSRPNKYDAIVAAYTQIVSTSKMNYRPNLILMNPIDYAAMQLEKDANGQYLRPFRVGDELIQGLRVESSTAVDLGKLWIGDFRYFNIRDYVALTVTFGWENDDFTRNLVTMIGEKRLMTYIKRQYTTAFVVDTFDNVITAITA